MLKLYVEPSNEEFYYINTNEIPGERKHDIFNMLSSHVKRSPLLRFRNKSRPLQFAWSIVLRNYIFSLKTILKTMITMNGKNTLTKSKVAEHSIIGTSRHEGSSERFMFASSLIGSMRWRFITADELKSMTPLNHTQKYKKDRLS